MSGYGKHEEEVNHPSRYNVSDLEMIEAIEDMGLGPGFCMGNIIKYVGRQGHKADTHGSRASTEHLYKALWYARRLVPRWNDPAWGAIALHMPTSELLRSRHPERLLGMPLDKHEAVQAWMSVIKEARIHGRLINGRRLKDLVSKIEALIRHTEQTTQTAESVEGASSDE